MDSATDLLRGVGSRAETLGESHHGVALLPGGRFVRDVPDDGEEQLAALLLDVNVPDDGPIVHDAPVQVSLHRMVDVTGGKRGGFGRVTLGQQGTPYQGATSWDGTNFTGGTGQPLGSRASGVSFSSELGGPFNFKAMVMDDNSHKNDMDKDTGYGEGADKFEVSGSLSAGGVNINAGYASSDTNTHMGATAGGAFGALGWEIGFETDDPDNGSEDTSRAGFFADYSIGSGAFYFYMADQSGAKDDSTWTAGYSHGLGSGVKVIGEHRDRDSDGTLSILAVVVGF